MIEEFFKCLNCNGLTVFIKLIYSTPQTFQAKHMEEPIQQISLA